jgi:hypothetical protein
MVKQDRTLDTKYGYEFIYVGSKSHLNGDFGKADNPAGCPAYKSVQDFTNLLFEAREPLYEQQTQEWTDKFRSKLQEMMANERFSTVVLESVDGYRSPEWDFDLTITTQYERPMPPRPPIPCKSGPAESQGTPSLARGPSKERPRERGRVAVR